MQESTHLEFYVHDELHSVKACDLPHDTSLCDYLRENAGLTGTKVMCREGGCGACIVTATMKNPTTGKTQTIAVNSCLVSIFSCSKWKISTVEGIGNRKNGFHNIQKSLALNNATQCGFCSPGMVMNMYALMKENLATDEEIERSFGGNMCRCTGYRPIVDALRKAAVKETEEGFVMLPDIEECTRKSTTCLKKCSKPCEYYKAPLMYATAESQWFKVFTIEQILNILRNNSKKECKLVAGNTAQGVYRDFALADVCIDINSVNELKEYHHNTNEVILGGNVSLTDAMKIFTTISKEDEMFGYLAQWVVHIDLVAHVPVRNIGTIAGNLMIKHNHKEFQSDIFLLLATIGATIVVVDTNKKSTALTPPEFLDFDMHNRVIKSVSLPKLSKDHKFGSYKIMPRAQNAHAIVNAGFLVLFEADGKKVKTATIVYGAINPTFIHAGAAEAYLVGKNLFDETTMQGLFAELDKELQTDHVLPDPGPEFRKKLAIALCYKFILSIAPNVNPFFKTGGEIIKRPISTAKQDYSKSKSKAPIGESTVKYEAHAQTSGEAEYIMDMPDAPNQLHGAFVLAKSAPMTTVTKEDTSEALKMQGVVGYINVKDIPGSNSFVPRLYPEKDEIFVDGTIRYFNQPVGLVLAKSRTIAERAAKLVKLTYGPQNGQPAYNARQAVKMNKNITMVKEQKRTREGANAKTTLKGTMDITWQYHYHMETQCCFVIPKENGEFDMYASTQGMDMNQMSAAECLGIQQNKINVFVRRVGGGYGGKITRSGLVSCAAILASYKYTKPVKIWMPFIDNMDVCGKRNPACADYTVSVDDKGVIQKLDMDVYSDVGIVGNELPEDMITSTLFHSYVNDTFEYKLYMAKTDNHAATWTRAPGSSEAVAILESVFENIAYSLKLDPLEVRLANLDKEKFPDLAKYFEQHSQWADTDKRKKDIEEFNKNHRWRKKGFSVIPLTYEVRFFGCCGVMVSIYHIDGTVAVAHGGVEIGQGINTKVAQVVAASLNIDINMVSVKPSNTLVSPNSWATGGSITSEAVCMAFQKCCQELLKRMDFPGHSTNWAEWAQQCFYKNINLNHTGSWASTEQDYNYNIYAVTSAEVELDVLTGNHIINRVDLLSDTGDSMSPLVDIGQVEGAFMMGVGYWTSEEIIIDTNGELKTNRTWTYKPPGIKDIPVEFNVKFPEASNPLSPFHTKATGEPAHCLAFAVPLALRQAIKSARGDGDKTKEEWFAINGPCNVEQNFMSCLSDYKQYKLN